MVDANSQAVPPPSSEGAQVQGEATGQVSAQSGQQKEQPVTLEMVRQVVSEIVNPLIQSKVAKSENRINQRIQEQFSALESAKSALNLSDEQVAQARQKIVVDAYAQPAAEPDEPPPSDSQPAADEIPAEVMPAMELMQERGVTIQEADPEFKQFIEPLINVPKVNPHKLYLAMDKAITAKQQRTNLQNDQATLRTPAGGGETPVGQTVDLNKPASYYLELAAKQEARNK